MFVIFALFKLLSTYSENFLSAVWVRFWDHPRFQIAYIVFIRESM